MIEVSHLTKRYGAHTAVSDLSFTIGDGQIYGFLGPNGAGKSTTMNIMTGCLAATSGEVKIDGLDIFEDAAQAKRLLGYLPEQPPLYLDRTPREYLSFVGRAKGLDKAELAQHMSDLVSFTIETASGTLDIEYLEDSCLAYTDRYTWFSLADGEYTALDNELTEDLVSLVTGLSWGECVDYDADVKDLGDYGLDTPSVTVSVSYIETTEVETNETDEDGEPVYETREDVQAIVDAVEALLA